MSKKRVAIIVVTYNRLTLLKEEIESLRNQSYNDSQIVVVNNGSTDGTIDWLNNQHDIVTITQKNLGGAGGFNTGIKYAAENGFEFCWIMDDDVICSHDALEELILAYNANDNLGFVCSNVHGTDGSPMNTPTPCQDVGIKGYSDIYEKVNAFSMVRVDMATFVSVLIPIKVVFDVGLPYKEFFIWGDDSEYTTRISKKYPCYVACKSIVVHKRSVQKPLSFKEEENPSRLKNYFYMFRNNGFRHLKSKSGKERGFFILESSFDLLGYLIRFDFKRLKIYSKALISLLSFHPHIEYPSNNK